MSADERNHTGADLARRIAGTLERASRDLPAEVEHGLARARAEALERAGRPAPWRRFLLPAGSLAAVAAAALLALTLVRAPQPADVAQAPEAPASAVQAAAEDLDIVASGESLDLIEDMDFVTWLAEEAHEQG